VPTHSNPHAGKIITVDYDQLVAQYTTDETRHCLSQRQISLLLAMCDYFRWEKRWQNLSITPKQLRAIVSDLENRLITECAVDCNEVESCLSTSTIITNINTTLVDIDTQITNVETDITNIENTVVELEACCGTTNTYPPLPDMLTAPDALCGAATYITDKLIELITQTYNDELTITLDEFLTALLGIGGFDSSFLKLFWDWMVANSYPNLIADCTARRDDVITALYCSELDRVLTSIEITNDPDFSTPVQDAFLRALDSVSDAKIALWAFLGSLQPDSGAPCLCTETFAWDWDLSPAGWTPPAGWGLVSSHPVFDGPTYLNGYGAYLGGSGYKTITIAQTFTIPNMTIQTFRARAVRNGTSTQIQTMRVQAGTFDNTFTMTGTDTNKTWTINQQVSQLILTVTVRQTFCGAAVNEFEFVVV